VDRRTAARTERNRSAWYCGVCLEPRCSEPWSGSEAREGGLSCQRAQHYCLLVEFLFLLSLNNITVLLRNNTSSSVSRSRLPGAGIRACRRLDPSVLPLPRAARRPVDPEAWDISPPSSPSLRSYTRGTLLQQLGTLIESETIEKDNFT